MEHALEVTEGCRHCLMCRHVCPVGELTRNEKLTPHGWAQLIALEKRGLSTWNEQTIDALYQCADCGACQSHCVYDQPLPDAIAAARAQLVNQDMAPPIVRELDQKLAQYANPYQPKQPEAPKGAGDAAVFIGDAAHWLRPELTDAALKLLQAQGVKPVAIGRGRDSGFLASSLGLEQRAREIAQANLKELADTNAAQLFVLDPGAHYAFKQMYADRLGIELPGNVEVVDLASFLAQRLNAAGNGQAGPDGDAKLAYIDPTHAVRALQRADAPRQLLQHATGHAPIELFRRKERAQPAGDTALAFTHPDLAATLTHARLRDAAQAGAAVLVSEDAGTLAELDKHAPAYNMQVRGLYELIAETSNA